nr:GNAT family N-acetyltransferase [Alysiella crassa]UOP07417.1 GNAT family N-acetyltransferase [Alysiella crassa]
MHIRFAKEQDVTQLFELMKELAIFEHYIDSFAITPEIVLQSGFRKNPPDFHSLVADDNGTIAGMLVYYFLPYTAQNRPNIYMKELYVSEAYRGQGVGEKIDVRLARSRATTWLFANQMDGRAVE